MRDKKVFTVEEVEQIERELQIALPSRCRETLLTVPFEPEEGDIHLWAFIDDVLRLIECNRLIRSQGYFGKKWQDELLIIGYVEDCLYYLNTAEKDPPVCAVEPNRKGVYDLTNGEEIAPNLTTWFADREEDRAYDLALEQKAEAEEQERRRRRAEARKCRKWWQFWV